MKSHPDCFFDYMASNKTLPPCVDLSTMEEVRDEAGGAGSNANLKAPEVRNAAAAAQWAALKSAVERHNGTAVMVMAWKPKGKAEAKAAASAAKTWHAHGVHQLHPVVVEQAPCKAPDCAPLAKGHMCLPSTLTLLASQVVDSLRAKT